MVARRRARELLVMQCRGNIAFAGVLRVSAQAARAVFHPYMRSRSVCAQRWLDIIVLT